MSDQNSFGSNINIRVDAELKEKVESLFADLGINMTTAITIFLKSAVNHDGIPFELKHSRPNEEIHTKNQTGQDRSDI